MGDFFSAAKRITLRTVALVLFYSGALKGINALGNKLKFNRQGEKLTFPFLKKAGSTALQILLYHRINDDKDPFFPGTPVDIFASQMEYVANNYTILPLEKVVDCVISGGIPDNAVAITFDDGYRDNYTCAFPILRRLQIPATIFLATDAIGSGKVLWHDRIFSAFRRTRVSFLGGLGDSALQTYAMRTLEEKLLAQNEILKLVRSVGECERSKLIEQLLGELRVADLREDPDLMLTWEQVREMNGCGISFGSHTVTHPILSTLSVERIRTEICQSKKTIEEQLGKAVTAFAYPNGTTRDFNETIKEMLKDAGYKCGLTTLFGTNSKNQDLFELRRVTPWDEEICNFGLRLSCYKLYA